MRACALAIATLGSLTAHEFIEPVDSNSENGRPVRKVRAIVLAFAAIFMSTVFAGHPRWEHYLRARWIEYLICAGLIVLIISGVAAEPEFIRNILGLGPDALREPNSTYGPFILTNMSLVACANSTLNLRWCLLFIFDVCAYIIVVFASSSELVFARPGPDLLIIGIVYGCICWGKWQCERYERMVFKRMLDEKCLRFQTEHQLSQVMENSPPGKCRRSADAVSVGESSLPETTNTGRLFKDDCSMGQMHELGKKEKWLILEEELKIACAPGSIIGSGGFGIVCQGYFHGSAVAIKIPLRNSAKTKVPVSDLANELRILRKLRHPHLVLFHGTCVPESGSDIALVLELVRGETLTAFIGQGIPEGHERGVLHSLEITTGLALALAYLHSRDPCIVHSDLKPANIMVQKFRDPWLERYVAHAKVLDFGLARLCTAHASIGGGSARWAAPEMLISRRPPKPKPSVDAYSFGKVMYYISTGIFPMAYADKKKGRMQAQTPSSGELVWPRASPYEEVFAEIATPCLQFDAVCRPTIHVSLAALTNVLVNQFGAQSPYVAHACMVDESTSTTDSPDKDLWTRLDMLRTMRATGLQAEPVGAPRMQYPRHSVQPGAVSPPGMNNPDGHDNIVASLDRNAGHAPSDVPCPDERTALDSIVSTIVACPSKEKLAPAGGNPQAPWRPVKQTEVHALIESLQGCLLRWQLEEMPGQCCSWHGALQLAASLIRRMQRDSCLPPRTEPVAQCQQCFIKTLCPGRGCDVCGHMDALGEERWKLEL